MFNPALLPVSALRREFEANDLDCTVCAILPAGFNPISPDLDTRKRSLSHLRECIETAAELGAHLLGGPLFAPIGYLPGHRTSQDEWKWAVEIFQSVVDLLDKYTMTLSIEPVNRSETFFLRTAAESREAVCCCRPSPSGRHYRYLSCQHRRKEHPCCGQEFGTAPQASSRQRE